jgi:cobalt/nickel transport system permease protein
VKLVCESDIAPAAPGRRRARRSVARRTAEAIGRHIGEVLENEELAARPGLLQRIDARARLLAILVFSVTASLLRSPWLLAAVFALALALAAASAVELASFARKVWGSAGLLAVLLAAPATTRLITPGPVLIPLRAISLTTPGVLGAVTLVLRVVASAGIALLVVWTMRWSDLLEALTRLKVPDVVVATLAMTQKQIVSLMRTVQQIHLARESRTLTAATTPENREWVTGRMAFVVQKSMKTADDVYDAMLARGFSGAVRLMPRPAGGAADWAHLAAAVAVAAVLLGLDRLVLR